MSDKNRDNDKKEKLNNVEEREQMGTYGNKPQMQQMCPMKYQCPMAFQCPMAGGQMLQQMPMMPMQQMPMQHMPMQQMPMQQMPMQQMPMQQMPMMPMQNMPGAGMRIKDWFDEWDEFSEDSSFEFDSDDFDYPEKYYMKLHKKHKYPFYGPPILPFYK